MSVSPPISVLLVDDQENIRELFRQVLGADHSFRIVGLADSGQAAVEMAVDCRPDIVVMAFGLPDMNGATAISKIKGELPDTRVITVSGLGDPGAYQAAISAGSSAWIRKTSAARELPGAIRRVHAGDTTSLVGDDDIPSIGDLVVHYQGVHDLESRAVAGLEALVRWGHPNGTLIAPEEFLAGAEMVGRVSEFDKRVSEIAARQLTDWQTRHPVDPPRWMSVNLSALDLRRPDLHDWIAAAVQGAGVDPSCFVLELKETVLIVDPNETSRRLDRLKGLGVGLALDDFGGTFSSLANVSRLPFDFVKTDRSCTAEVPESADAMEKMETFARDLAAAGMTGIAKGVERTSQATALREVGWRLGQGFLFSRPEPPEVCESALAAAPSASQ